MISFPPIVFEDNELLVLDKPSGIVVNPSETAKEETIYSLVLSYLDKDAPGIGERAGIVHRLDKDTSGLLVIAKTEASFNSLQEQFKNRSIEKEYTALVHGNLFPEEGKISAPISRNPFNRKRFGVFPGGRISETRYKVVEHFNAFSYSFSLINVRPLTGRTHQIRVHLKYIGNPVVSDPIYGGRKMYRADLKFCQRLFLHASKISFLHPKTGERVKFSSELPEVLAKILNELTRVVI